MYILKVISFNFNSLLILDLENFLQFDGLLQRSIKLFYCTPLQKRQARTIILVPVSCPLEISAAV